MAGAGPSSSEYQGKTLDYDVPSAPRIRALKSNLSSIELMWSVQGEEPISGFVISYKSATQNELKSSVANVAEKVSTSVDDHMNDWKTIKIELEPLSDANSIDTVFTHPEPAPVISTFHRRTYVLGLLRCGTKYFIYVNAYNGAGQGDPSEVILARTEGNVPVPPESVQDFVQPNISNARINLNQWKRLGCPIEKFELDFRVFGDVATNRKLTITPSTSVGEQSTMIEVESNIHSNITAELIIELTNLFSGSWYELLIQAVTEAGTVHREYIFSTRKSDGSTIAPLTLKAIEEFHGRTNGQQQGRQGSSSTRSQIYNHSFRSSMFTQLHYIVPVSCTLVILFLVFVVVCAIQTNRQNFLMFSLVANTRQRHHKVASGSKLSGQYSIGEEGVGQLGSCMDSNDGSTVGGTGGAGGILNLKCNNLIIYMFHFIFESHQNTFMVQILVVWPMAMDPRCHALHRLMNCWMDLANHHLNIIYVTIHVIRWVSVVQGQPFVIIKLLISNNNSLNILCILFQWRMLLLRFNFKIRLIVMEVVYQVDPIRLQRLLQQPLEVPYV